jgi:hypothetical protein
MRHTCQSSFTTLPPALHGAAHCGSMLVGLGFSYARARGTQGDVVLPCVCGAIQG